MSKTYILWLIVAFSTMYISCEKFIEGVEVSFDLPEEENILVPYCFVNTNDTNIRVAIQSSQAILDTSSSLFLATASVELFKNDVLWLNIDQVEIDPISGIPFYTAPLPYVFADADSQDVFQLKVSAEGFESVMATQQITTIPQINNVSYTIDAALETIDLLDVASVSINNQATDRYYHAMIYATKIGTLQSDTLVDQYSSTYNNQAISNDPNILNAVEGVIATTNSNQMLNVDIGLFYGGSSTIGLEPDTIQTTVNITLRSINHDEYYYQKSLSAYNDALENPFSEPVILYGNFSGGLGLFSIYSTINEVFTF